MTQPNVVAFPIRGVVPVYHCAAGCGVRVQNEGDWCLGCAAADALFMAHAERIAAVFVPVTPAAERGR
jgi:hypothetical protein